MKLNFVILFLAAVLIIAGCASQTSGSQTNGSQANVSQAPATSKTFVSTKEAYDSGLSLKCTGKVSVYTINYYFSNKNIRKESIGLEQTLYQIITNDNHYYSWMSTSPEKSESISGDYAKQFRNTFISEPFTTSCTEQSVDSSLFEPPKK